MTTKSTAVWFSNFGPCVFMMKCSAAFAASSRRRVSASLFTLGELAVVIAEWWFVIEFVFKADQLPARAIEVASILRIAKAADYGVSSNQIEELGFLNLLEQRNLLVWFQIGKTRRLRKHLFLSRL